MLKRTESRGLPSAPSRCERSTPSNLAPSRWIASRDRWFRASVCRHTDCTCQLSKAWASISRFISVFTPVLIASLLSQV
jgi:hypothetical protein